MFARTLQKHICRLYDIWLDELGPGGFENFCHAGVERVYCEPLG